jgi:hypothetical protein
VPATGSMLELVIPPNNGIMHAMTCSAASVVGPLAAAHITSRVAGIGVVGSAGAGLILGGGACLGIQLVADPKGNVGLSFSGSWSSILIGASLNLLSLRGVKSVVMTDRIIGCPHEQGADYPEGDVCPQCPFWAHRDRWTGDIVQ